MIDYNRLPPHLYLSGGWKRPRRDGTIGPIEQFSPSQIKKFAEGCPTAWGLSYIAGVKEQQGPAAENGTILHDMIDKHFDGTPLPLGDKDPKRAWIATRALPGLLYLPNPNAVDEIYREQTVWIDTRIVAPELEILAIQMKKDLEFRIDKRWHVYDHKSTSNFKYSLAEFNASDTKKRAAFLADIQGVCYGLDTTQRRQTSDVAQRWVYYLMDPEQDPEAHPLDVVLLAEQLAEPARRIFQVADRMRQIIRLRTHPLELPKNPSACMEYFSPARGPNHPKGEKPATGGCQYRPAIGGPCTYGATGTCYSHQTLVQGIDLMALQLPPLPGSVMQPPSAATGAPPMALPTPGYQPTPAAPAPVVLPQAPFMPPEAQGFVPSAAPVSMPTLPSGFTYGLDGKVVAVQAGAPVIDTAPAQTIVVDTTPTAVPARRGRKPGSKNKPKDGEPVLEMTLPESSTPEDIAKAFAGLKDESAVSSSEEIVNDVFVKMSLFSGVEVKFTVSGPLKAALISAAVLALRDAA